MQLMMKGSLALALVSVALLFGLTITAVAREVRNEKHQAVTAGQLLNINSVALPNNKILPLETENNGQDTQALTPAISPAPSPTVVEQKKWCVAKPSSTDTQLDDNVQFACTQGYKPFSCSTIQLGGNCYNPANRVATASVVMNLFFQSQGQLQSACYFNGSGLITSENPSTGSCIFPSN